MHNLLILTNRYEDFSSHKICAFSVGFDVDASKRRNTPERTLAWVYCLVLVLPLVENWMYPSSVVIDFGFVP